MRKNRIFTTTKNTKKNSKSPWYAPHPHPQILGTPLKWKVGASAYVCRVTLCVYCWVHFVNIAKMYGNLFSGRSSKVLPWSWLKSLGLGLGLEVQSLGLGLGLDKKVLFTSLTLSVWCCGGNEPQFWVKVAGHRVVSIGFLVNIRWSALFQQDPFFKRISDSSVAREFSFLTDTL